MGIVVHYTATIGEQLIGAKHFCFDWWSVRGKGVGRCLTGNDNSLRRRRVGELLDAGDANSNVLGVGEINS